MLALLLLTLSAVHGNLDSYTYHDEYGARQGPVTAEDIQALFFDGVLADNTLIYKSGDVEWKKIKDQEKLRDMIQTNRRNGACGFSYIVSC